MTRIAEAAGVVAVARRRLALAARLRAACDGVAGGALVALLAWGVLALTGTAAPAWLLPALPLAGALFTASTCARAFVSSERAALALDRAAHTDEAFVSALTAEDAQPGLRELAAEWALARCRRDGVARALPFDVPRGAPRAVLAAALLAAVLLVPGGGEARATGYGAATQTAVRSGAGAPGSTDAGSPAERARALRAALDAARHADPSLTAAVRRDVPALTAGELEALARAVAAAGDGDASAAAGRALEALAAGDTDRAAAELRTALGGAVTSAAGANPGGGAAALEGDSKTSPGSSPAPSWPLRYDRTVRRWFELGRTAHGSAPGGGR